MTHNMCRGSLKKDRNNFFLMNPKVAKLKIIKNGECRGAEVVRGISKRLSIEWLSLCTVML